MGEHDVTKLSLAAAGRLRLGAYLHVTTKTAVLMLTLRESHLASWRHGT
jgi:hypothetical protein